MPLFAHNTSGFHLLDNTRRAVVADTELALDAGDGRLTFSVTKLTARSNNGSSSSPPSKPPPPPSLSLSEVMPSTYCGRPRAFQSCTTACTSGREQTHRGHAPARWSSGRNRAYHPFPAATLHRPVRIVRESILLDTVNAIRVGMFALIRPVITSTDGRCVASTVDARRTRFLCQTRNQLFHFLTNGHHQVGKFIHQHHDVRQFSSTGCWASMLSPGFQYGSGIGRPIRAASAIFSL